MKCRREELPEKCQNCRYLMCDQIYMEGTGYYYCRKVRFYSKKKAEECNIKEESDDAED